jgi:DHA1 family bicyclomycin/chloramphenicol resistance-like MFS transporter
MAPILYQKDLGVKLGHFGFYQGTMATVFAIVSLLSERLFTWFGIKKCFFGSIALIVVSLIDIAVLILVDARNPVLITTAMALMSAGLICPVNILCPYAYRIVQKEKGKLNATIMSLKWISTSLFIQFISFFYCGSFRIIGSVVALTMIIALFGSRKLLKIDLTLEEKE